eukprot:205594-Pyramimonas_sp.AAC.2
MLDMLVDLEGSWASLLLRDLEWLPQVASLPLSFPSPGDTSWWIGLARREPKFWKKIIKAVEMGATGAEMDQQRLMLWRKDIMAQCVANGSPLPLHVAWTTPTVFICVSRMRRHFYYTPCLGYPQS